MALVGGGNPANPVGIGQALNYIGNHAYAYSGWLLMAVVDLLPPQH